MLLLSSSHPQLMAVDKEIITPFIYLYRHLSSTSKCRLKNIWKEKIRQFLEGDLGVVACLPFIRCPESTTHTKKKNLVTTGVKPKYSFIHLSE